MSNFVCKECGCHWLDMTKGVFKTAREVQLENDWREARFDFSIASEMYRKQYAETLRLQKLLKKRNRQIRALKQKVECRVCEYVVSVKPEVKPVDINCILE